ncbi:hypothetical protein KGMB02408_40540 [Bacteroides faecalis]|uniref:Uncharacterized protein n=1 Tax=Bacteroides faecalis TaxID=2447885 RepID=A0A401LZX4_9BACE|nr:hypothetical protein KGMB02408_40540 [Bacteroides faecalis]
MDISVKDKNYFNVDNVSLESPKSESLIFRKYVPTLYYSLRNEVTGEIIEEQGVFNVTDNNPTHSITFCECLPFGKYVLTVWGGLTDNTSLTDQSLTNILHNNQMEGYDVYLVHDTLVYDMQNTRYNVALERATGKLLMQIINLPSTVRYADHSVNQIYERVTHQFKYINPITVRKQDSWDTTPDIILSTILAPSTGEHQANVHLNLYDETDQTIPALTPKDVKINMKRNELTSLRYVYDEEKEDFNIYVLNNDTWELIYNLDID